MAKFSKTLEMANVICRFGEKKVLLDMLEEIVLPAFLDKKLVRSYDQTSYLFCESQVVVLDESKNVYGIAGHFVKDTILEREQIYDRERGLISDTERIRSSPSALFVLILNNHRLLYLKETRHAPSMETFGVTLERFLLKKHKAYIDRQFTEHQQKRTNDPSLPKIYKVGLMLETPWPDLKIVPLASKESLDKFIDRYRTLKRVQVQLLDTNSEGNNDPFFDQARKKKKAIGSKKTIIQHQNDEGLDKNEATAQLKSATAQGNNFVKLDGEDKKGDKLVGNNEDFNIRVPISDIGPTVPSAAKTMYNSFNELTITNTIEVPAKEENGNALKRFFDSLFEL